MPTLIDMQLADGTRFITHQQQTKHGNDRYVFEAKAGKLLSISIESPEIERFRDLFNGHRIFEASALDATETSLGTRHSTIHLEAGLKYGDSHEHFASRREKPDDGIHMLPFLVPTLRANTVFNIVALIEQTRT